jgi:hypothetical protein
LPGQRTNFCKGEFDFYQVASYFIGRRANPSLNDFHAVGMEAPISLVRDELLAFP